MTERREQQRLFVDSESFSAAFVVGFFDSLDDLHTTYDHFAGHTGLEANENGWKLLK